MNRLHIHLTHIVVSASLAAIPLAASGVFDMPPASAQTSTAVIEVLDRNSQPIKALVDGNRIRVRVSLPARAETDAEATLFLDDALAAFASCRISAGDQACTTDEVETLGWYWVEGGEPRPSRGIRLRVRGEALAESAVSVAPRPVVFLHGLISNPAAFDSYIGKNGFLASIGLEGYAVGDGQFEGRLNTGSFLDPAGRTFTIAENAAQVGLYVDGVLRATGAEQVDLVAHSMGGLIARYYLDRVMNGDRAAQLIMLGTPNGGSPCAVGPASLGFYMPSSLELQPAYMNGIFNRQITDTHGVPVYAVAGTLLADPTVSPCSDVPSDSTVSLGSVTASPLVVAGKIPLEHNFLPSDGDVFTQFVRPLLQTPAGQFAPPANAGPAPVTGAARFTRTYAGHLDPGAEATVTINIDPGVSVASFGLYDTTRSLTISVQGASGKTLELDLQNKGILIDDPETLLYLGYGFENPKPGAWVVTLRTSDTTPGSGADYALYARFTGGATLKAAVDVLVPRPGQTVGLSASLDGAQIESAQAHILAPDGSTQTIDFSSDEGQFTAIFTPQQPGLHGIQVNVNGKTADGAPVDRAAWLAVEVQPTPIPSWVTQAKFIAVLAGILLLISSPFIFLLRMHRRRVSA